MTFKKIVIKTREGQAKASPITRLRFYFEDRPRALLGSVLGVGCIIGLAGGIGASALNDSRLQAKVDAFRTKKETIKATYSAAEAQTRINEAFSGISEEMGDVGLAIQRAEDKTLEMQSRAGAVDELLASGALEDPTGSYKDDITRELDAMAADASVENELAALKQQLAVGAGPAQQTAALPAGQEQRNPAAAGQIQDADIVNPAPPAQPGQPGQLWRPDNQMGQA